MEMFKSGREGSGLTMAENKYWRFARSSRGRHLTLHELCCMLIARFRFYSGDSGDELKFFLKKKYKVMRDNI